MSLTRAEYKARSTAHYAEEEFREAYRLEPDEASRLYRKFGPGKRELDLLMRAKGYAEPKTPAASIR